MRAVLSCVLCIVSMCLGLVCAVDLYPGGAGWALRFDGVNDFAILSADMPPAPRTIEFWAHPMELRDGMGEVFVHYNSAGSIIGQASMSRGRNLFLIVYNGVEVWHAVTTINNVHTANVAPGDRTLYHYAWVEEEGNYSIYINGVLANAYPTGLAEDDHLNDIAPLPWLLGARAVYSGGDYIVDDRCFGGVIDEVRWWSVARTQDEIKEFMQKPVSNDALGLVRQWTFDAGHDFTDGQSYALGGGDHSRAPKWVPSPVQTYGAPKSMEVMDLADEEIDICAVLVPASPNASVRASLRERPKFGTLNVSQNASFELMAVQDATSGRQTHCAPVLYSTGVLNDTEAYEEIMFDLIAELSNGQILQTSQILAVRILANLAPIAGVARAVETNGKDNYVSLGLWNLADDWSMSIWVYPNAVVENAEIISRHLSDGTNIFLVEYFLGGYYFRVDCVRGCWHDGLETPLTSRFTAPVEADDELVYDTGLTGSQVRARRSRPQHIAITFRCITRGSQSINTQGEVKIYSDGMLIGASFLPVCVTTPLDPMAYGTEAYVPERPAPWELGAEYDGGVLDAHQENVAVTPSNFFNGVFDELIFWNRTLTASEVQVSADGGIPRDSDIVVHYTFDEDDHRSCDSQRFWQPDLECHGVNEHEGRVVPRYPFMWTNSLINGARHVRSPFSKVKGSPIHVVMARGTCQEAKMRASDPNGDGVRFHLIQTMETANGRVEKINYDTLGFCDHLDSGRRDVEVNFDVCDEHGLCASSVSGLGKVIFHIFDHGPEIIRFQGLPSSLGLRIAFSEPTDMPNADTADAINRLLEFDPPLNIVHGQWEPGGMFLWVFPDHVTAASLFSNNATVCLSADGSCPWIPQSMIVKVKETSVLRDAARLKFVSTSVSPQLEDATCTGGTVFFSDEIDCLPCPSGEIARKQGSEQVCSPCLEGDFQVGSTCEHCPMGQWSNQVGATACRDCLVNGAISGVGSRSPESCFCPAGTYEERKVVNGVIWRFGVSCLLCPEGMVCEADSREVNFRYGNGTGKTPELMEGYMSLVEEPLRVYLCKGRDFCPGGPPASCARNRDADSVACGVCKDGYSEMGFTCVTCDDAGYLLLPLLALLGVILALMILMYMVCQDRISESSSAMGPTIIAGLTVTAIQTLAVFDNIALVWGEPIKSFLALMAFLSLDINFLRTGCLIGSNPLVKLVFAQLIVPTLAFMLTLILLLRKYFYDRSLHLTSALSNGVGSIYLLLFTTIVLSAAKPFVCYRHPGGEESSMNSAPSVLCFDGNTEHGALVTVSFIALLIGILPFITVVLWGSFRFPYYVSGHYDRGGLKRFNFLYRRFQPWAYYFSSILLVRSLCVCLVPVLIHDEPGVHALLLAIVLLAYAFFQSTLSPWRNVSANLLDNWMSGMMVLLLILGMLTTDVHVDDTILKISTSVFLAGTIAIFVGAAAMSLYGKWRPGIAYHRFICHHKAGAAAQARHLQMLLSNPGGPGRAEQRCFIDSDHLKNLDTLFDIVRSQLRTLVVFLTKETLRRPWCAGEVTTAYRAKIDAVVVHMPDCDACPLIQDPLNDYVHQPIDDLVAAGITSEDMAAAFRWVFSETMRIVEPNLSLSPGQVLPDVAAGILQSSRLQPTLMHRVDKGAVHIVSNPTDVEATASANILQMIINQEAAQVIRKGVFLFCNQPDLQIQLTDPLAVIFVLTAGCLQSGEVVSAIARSANLPRIPVHASGFVFPTIEYYSSTLPNLLDMRKLDVVNGIESMQVLFRSISVPVTPAGSLSILKAQALEVIHRIGSPGMDPTNSNKLQRDQGSGVRHQGSGGSAGRSAASTSNDLKQASISSIHDRNQIQIVIPDQPDAEWHWRCTF